MVILVLNIFLVVDQCKASTQDMKNREEILKYIQNVFKKCYPLCCVYAYGSFNNGFGLRQSDLDVCVMVKDNVCFGVF